MRLLMPLKRRPAVNVTSLIDVLFLLLTFFLVSTQFIDQSALKVELPAMAHSERAQQARRFVLNMSKDGQMALDGVPVDQGTLETLLKEKAAEIDASAGLFVRADHRLTLGNYMLIMDIVRGSGIGRIAIATVESAK